MVILVGGLVGTASAFSSAAMEAAASHMYNLGLVKGQVTTGGKVDLALGAEITRAELVTLVVRAFGKEEMAKSLAKAPSFPDVAGHWSAGYVATAMKIVEETGGEPFGLPDGTFNPTGRVTMAQSLAFVMKFLGVGRDQAHSWPEDYIAAGIKAGLITRADAAVIRTAKNDNATRGQVFYMLDNSFSTYKLPDGQSMYEKYVLKSKPVITVDHYPAETHEAFIAITGTAADATVVYVDYGNGQPF